MRLLSAFLIAALATNFVGVGAGVEAVANSGEIGKVGPAKVLVIGDSVFTAFDHVPSARKLMNEQQPTIFAVQGCQKLIDSGCRSWVKLSALDQLKKHAGKFSDAVVIGTGYNDRIGAPFRIAVIAITSEAARQGVDVIWITYRQVGHVRGKSTTMNKQLVKLGQKIPNLEIADWNSFSDDKKDWFRRDRIHLVTPGANGLAQLLNESVAQVVARREATGTTANLVTTTTLGG